jgi:hypothetical protein
MQYNKLPRKPGLILKTISFNALLNSNTHQRDMLYFEVSCDGFPQLTFILANCIMQRCMSLEVTVMT